MDNIVLTGNLLELPEAYLTARGNNDNNCPTDIGERAENGQHYFVNRALTWVNRRLQSRGLGTLTYERLGSPIDAHFRYNMKIVCEVEIKNCNNGYTIYPQWTDVNLLDRVSDTIPMIITSHGSNFSDSAERNIKSKPNCSLIETNRFLKSKRYDKIDQETLYELAWKIVFKVLSILGLSYLYQHFAILSNIVTYVYHRSYSLLHTVSLFKLPNLSVLRAFRWLFRRVKSEIAGPVTKITNVCTGLIKWTIHRVCGKSPMGTIGHNRLRWNYWSKTTFFARGMHMLNSSLGVVIDGI